MTTLTIGDLNIEATPFDLLGEASRMRHGTSTLPSHKQALVQHFDRRAVRKLVSFKCPDGPWTRHGVDDTFKHVVKQDFRIVGVDMRGRPTEEATATLLETMVNGSGAADLTAFGKLLDTRFGLHIETVPRDFFAKDWAPRYSFDIFALVRSHVVELWHPLLGKGNLMLLSIPFEVEYFARTTFDCKSGKEVFDTPHAWMLPRDLDVPDKAANTSLRPRLKQELQTSEAVLVALEGLLNLHKERAERFPDEPKWAEHAKEAQKEIEHAKKDIERRKERLGG